MLLQSHNRDKKAGSDEAQLSHHISAIWRGPHVPGIMLSGFTRGCRYGAPLTADRHNLKYPKIKRFAIDGVPYTRPPRDGAPDLGVPGSSLTK